MEKFNKNELSIIIKLIEEEIKNLDLVVTQKKEEIGNDIDVLENNDILNNHLKYKAILEKLLKKFN